MILEKQYWKGAGMCQYLPRENFVEIELTGRNKDKLLKSFLGTQDNQKTFIFHRTLFRIPTKNI